MIFIPIITYASGTWGHAIHHSHNKRRLLSAQRRALLYIAKAYSTAPTSSLQVITRKPPIDLYITLCTKKWKIKHKEEITINSNCINPMDIEQNIPYSKTIDFSQIINLNDDIPHSAITIYTDGSKADDRVGCSFVVYTNSEESYHKKFRLANHCSIIQAELLAILEDFTWCSELHSHTDIHIITDSTAAIQIIRNNNTHPTANKIKKILLRSSNNYYLTWTKAHQGTRRNEWADTLAKEATTDDSLPIQYNAIPFSHICKTLWEELQINWQTAWDKDHNITTYAYLPNIKHRNDLIWLNPSHNLTQFLTNHGRFNSYLNRFGFQDNNLCAYCGV
ncbi:uncharacterized protein LOC111615665 [Centruroides sculpturatus]|uniref:uncharacterized protein LOC111615665 n=1 Tax=Centruroides sculpturatus TaxID=218467 RepID=UPI000C6DA8D3|nr:uncharacterized protein LOC111615665 [Centruroides sculpturatus]